MNRSVKQWKKYGKEAAGPICWSCQYLSDLRGTKRRFQCRAALDEIPAGEYTTETWNDAIYYITGEKTEYSTPKEAKKGLMIRLEKNSQR